jgi:hypothetical protein
MEHTADSLRVAAAMLGMLAAGMASGAALFADTDELAVVLELPLQRIIRDKLEQIPQPATLHYREADGRLISLPLQVRARGNKRLRSCALPPLRLEFGPDPPAGILFTAQDELKLVTQCRRQSQYRDYLLLEYLIYRAYHLVTPASFRTRLLSVTYRETGARGAPRTAPAFLVESVDEVSQRLQLRRVRRNQLSSREMDPAQMNLLELFQFMIGNTDWSAHSPSAGDSECCHNGRVLGPAAGTGALILVPFDFDESGLIDAHYAAPSPVVGAGSVRQRVYRGSCSHNAQVPASIRRYQELRPEFERLFATGGPGGRATRRALDYLRGFYAILDDPRQLQQQVYDACRSVS